MAMSVQRIQERLDLMIARDGLPNDIKALSIVPLPPKGDYIDEYSLSIEYVEGTPGMVPLGRNVVGAMLGLEAWWLKR